MAVKFHIVKNILTLPSDTKYRKELNLVSWNDREPVYDLRGWDEGHTQMTKGVTFTKDELIYLKNLLGGITL